MKANRAPRRLSPAAPAALLPVLALAAFCAPPPPPLAPPPPAAVQPAPPPPAAPAPADWRDAPQTPGTWRWRMEGDRSVAEYAPYAGQPLARLTCDPMVPATILWRNWPAIGATPLTVTTTGTRKLLTALPDGAGGAIVSFVPTDPLLDAIAFSRGRFMVEMPGAPVLYLPAWPELSRVIEDCRQKLERAPAAAPRGAAVSGPKP